MLIRRETPADQPFVHEVTAAAFAGTESGPPVEAVLLGALRDCAGWLPAFSLVAIGDKGAPVGHVICTRGYIGTVPALGLGPLSVHPDHQGEGVGSALMHAIVGAADAAGEPAIGLLGSPGYYRRFGFRPAAEYGVISPEPEWGTAFQLRPLAAYSSVLTGPFRYAQPFADL